MFRLLKLLLYIVYCSKVCTFDGRYFAKELMSKNKNKLVMFLNGVYFAKS